MQPCVGYPEPDIGITSTRETLGPYQGTGSRELDQKQDLNDRTTYDFVCPPGCGDVAIQRQNGGENSGVYGNGTYGDESYICASAVHAGVIDDAIGGRFTLQLQRGWGPLAGHDAIGHERDLPVATRFGIESRNLVSTSPRRPRQGWMRTFTLEPYPVMTVEVQTIIGAPNAPLESNCDHLDIQPPQAAKVRAVRVCVWCACMYVCACESYAALALQLIRRSLQLSRPTDVALFVNASLTDQEMLYIADAANNAIRMATAVCSKVCENGGYCISEEKCVCPDGWVGDDCSMPVCKPSCDSLNPGGCVAVWRVAVWLRLTKSCWCYLPQQLHLHCAEHVHMQTWLRWTDLRGATMRARVPPRYMCLPRHLPVRLRLVRPQLHHACVHPDVRQRRQLHITGRVHVPVVVDG